jgi:ferredoxin
MFLMSSFVPTPCWAGLGGAVKTGQPLCPESLPMRVLANLNLCQGHARCEDICPGMFSTDAVEGKVVIEQPEFPPELEEKVRLAVRNCPEGALRIAKVVRA